MVNLRLRQVWEDEIPGGDAEYRLVPAILERMYFVDFVEALSDLRMAVWMR